MAKERIIPIFIPHLGCPHRCVFCNQNSISGEQVPVTPRTAAETLKAGLSKLGGESAQAAFYGGSFTAIPAAEQEAFLQAVQPFLQSGKLTGLRVSTRPDCIDGETLARLRAGGVQTVELGAQSMDGEVLRMSRRGHTAEDTERAAGLVRAAGFRLILQMMTGLPGDSREKALETGRVLAALQPDGVRIYPAVVLRDTALFELWRRGEYEPQSVEAAAELCGELLEIFHEAGIPVIRTGLNPSEDLGGGQAAAGAYHPALGEMARSRFLYQRAKRVLAGVPEGSDAVLGVRREWVSPMIGQKRENIRKLQAEFGLHSLRVRPVFPDGGEIVLLEVAKPF
ncbi:elongator complex protein 3 [Papillibacter cinnamivorans]|uniref:Radical_SAM C-terminal domain-containing protein n=1 Tax=Papillibacter cinnamivorans DSM 12816 TaxID=1122930 RepID=A0A1W1ZEA0_9FIRM|nr:radical SAM protein [Papillibacter cinnamivorans]SMC46717.1 Radical_SAM C-terminal domain-containing protein [Papillibacter cinnamivorans DSM 12816]